MYQYFLRKRVFEGNKINKKEKNPQTTGGFKFDMDRYFHFVIFLEKYKLRPTLSKYAKKLLLT